MPRFKDVLVNEVTQTNPFLESLIIPVKDPGQKEPLYRQTKPGVFIEKVTDVIYKEQTQIIKLFTSPEFRKKKAQLTPRAAHLLMWCIDQLDYAQDILVIKAKDYIEESQRPGDSKKMSINTFKLAAEELCESNFLNKMVKYHNVYFFNPKYAFKGSRPKKYPNNIKKLN